MKKKEKKKKKIKRKKAKHKKKNIKKRNKFKMSSESYIKIAKFIDIIQSNIRTYFGDIKENHFVRNILKSDPSNGVSQLVASMFGSQSCWNLNINKRHLKQLSNSSSSQEDFRETDDTCFGFIYTLLEDKSISSHVKGDFFSFLGRRLHTLRLLYQVQDTDDMSENKSLLCRDASRFFLELSGLFFVREINVANFEVYHYADESPILKTKGLEWCDKITIKLLQAFSQCNSVSLFVLNGYMLCVHRNNINFTECTELMQNVRLNFLKHINCLLQFSSNCVKNFENEDIESICNNNKDIEFVMYLMDHIEPKCKSNY